MSHPKIKKFEKRVLGKIVGHKRDKATEVQLNTSRGVPGFLLLTKYYSGDQIIKMRWAGHVSRMGDKRGAYRLLVGRLTWKT